MAPGRCRRGVSTPRRPVGEEPSALVVPKDAAAHRGGGRPVGRADRPGGGGPGRAVPRRADPAGSRSPRPSWNGSSSRTTSSTRRSRRTRPPRPVDRPGSARWRQQAEQSRADVAQLAATAYKTGGLRTADGAAATRAAAPLLDRLGTLDQLTRQRQQQHLPASPPTSGGCSTRRPGWTPRWPGRPRRPGQLAAGKKRIEQDLAEALRDAPAGVRAGHRGARPKAGVRPRPRRARPSPAAPARRCGTRTARSASRTSGAPTAPNGYDCSGLTLGRLAGGRQVAAAQRGDAVERVTHGSAAASCAPVTWSSTRGLGHVALYVGGGQVIDAPSAGATCTSGA